MVLILHYKMVWNSKNLTAEQQLLEGGKNEIRFYTRYK